MKIEEAQDLLNAMANDLVPELHLKFRPNCQQPMILSSIVMFLKDLPFDIEEIKMNKTPDALKKLFLSRLIIQQKELVNVTKGFLTQLENLQNYN